MLYNILQIEYEAKQVISKGKRGAIILFDFRAAFPSMSQTFLMDIMEEVGLGGQWKVMLKKFYIRNVQKIGQKEGHFEARAGIRQGCPISPLLFAIAADMLLRKLKLIFPDAGVHAFADDTGVVIDDIMLLPRILDIFQVYAGFSNLHLNLSKTVVIPLFEADLEELKNEMTKSHPDCFNLQWAYHCKYLGIHIGPEGEKHAWKEALAKYRTRVNKFAGLALGANYNVKVYNSLAFSVLSFVSQFYRPPQEVLDAESWALKKLFPGPYNWARPEELKHRMDWFKLGHQPRDVDLNARAAQLRLWVNEEWFYGKEDALKMLCKHSSVNDNSSFRMLNWMPKGILGTLIKTKNEYEEALGKKVITHYLPNDKARKTQQKQFYKEVDAATWKVDKGRWIGKMRRWNLQIDDFRLTSRMDDHLIRAATLLPPRVRSAVFCTWWNRTCTARRFQRHSACTLCGAGKDEVEHWPFCKTVRWWATNLLNLPITMLTNSTNGGHTALAELFGLGLLSKDDSILVKLGCLLYLTVDAHNTLRHDKDLDLSLLDTRRARGMDVLRSAVAGHPTSSKYILPFPNSVAFVATSKRNRAGSLDEARAGRRRHV